MFVKTLLTCPLVMLPGLVMLARAEAPADRPVTLAHRAWVITDLVLARHIDPPARQQMLLGGVKALYRAAGRTPPPELAAQVSAVADESQLAALLGRVWPKAAAPDPDGSLEDHMVGGLLGPREGRGEGDAYLPPQALKAHQVLTGNRYVGTGVQIGYDQKEKLAQIINPFPGGPCRKAGGKPGDLIVSIDGHDMKGAPLREFVKRLQGEEGTPVTAVVRQPKSKETRTLNMIRGVIPFASVLGWQRKGEDSWSFRIAPDSPVGYLRVSDINVSTPHQLRRLEPLVRAEGVRAVVLDMRFTAGSDMGHAALTADALLDGGVMWRVRDRAGHVKEYKADRDSLFRDMPLAVLAGPHTERMAEAVVAALQDNHRAVVVGEPTRGNTAVTTLIPAPDGQGALLLRTGVRERVGTNKTSDGDDPGLLPGPASVRPDYAVAFDGKLMGPLHAWSLQQEVPEPDPSVKPPHDPQLVKAVAALRAALEKKGGGARGASAP
jgi:C-terminal peptidase prc